MGRFIAIAAALALIGAKGPSLGPAGFNGTIVLADGKTGAILHKEGGSLDQKWRLASFTKQVVAVLVMQLVEAGRIGLDDQIALHLPAFAGRYLTIRQLLSHRSGLRNPEHDDATADAYYAMDEAGQRVFCSGPKRSDAGVPVFYNNCDFVILGQLLEVKEGKPWFAMVKERINARAGSKFVVSSRGAARGTFGGKAETLVSALDYGAAGALHGSPRDVAKFDAALLSGRLLGEAARAEMWRGDPDQGYVALGQWSFAAPLKGCEGWQPVIERRGQIGGVQIRNLIFPSQQKVLIVMTRSGDFDYGELWQGKGALFDMASNALCKGS